VYCQELDWTLDWTLDDTCPGTFALIDEAPGDDVKPMLHVMPFHGVGAPGAQPEFGPPCTMLTVTDARGSTSASRPK
jgi:hypothetical protein